MRQKQAPPRRMVSDFTQGNVTWQLLAFAGPLFCSGLLQTAYGMVDMAVVGRFVGKNGLSAVSVGSEVLSLLTFVAMGLSSAGQIILAQYVGARQREEMGRLVGTLSTAMVASAAVLTAACLVLRPQLLDWLNTPEDIWAETWDYITVCTWGLVFISGYNMVSAILRGLGDARHPFLFIAVAAVLNTALDLLLVAGWGMGVFGAALATVVSQGVSFLWALAFLYRRREELSFDFRPESFRPDPDNLARLFRLGIPMILQTAAITFSKLVLTSWINPYGVVIVSVTAVGNKVVAFANVFSQAFSTAGGSMVAQNIGAGRYDRVPRIVGAAFAADCTAAALCGLVMLLWPQGLFRLFIQDPEVLEASLLFVPVAMVLFLGIGLRPPMFALINGSGNARLNLVVALLDGIVVRIGLAWVLGFGLGMGFRGFWYGNAFAGLVPFFVGGAYLLSGRWRTDRYLLGQNGGGGDR